MVGLFDGRPPLSPFAIGCEEAASSGLAVVTMLDPRTVAFAARRPNGDPLWVVRDIVYGLDEARREVAAPRSNAVTVDVMPADRADAFVAHVVERMQSSDPYDLHHGMAWDFLCDRPQVWRIVEWWREAEFSARITVAAARRWMEASFDAIGTTLCGSLSATLPGGEVIQAMHVHLTSGCEVWIASERDALNHLRSMLGVVLHDYPRERWCVVLRRPIETDRHGDRFKASVRFMVVPREHADRFIDWVERRLDWEASAG